MCLYLNYFYVYFQFCIAGRIVCKCNSDLMKITYCFVRYIKSTNANSQIILGICGFQLTQLVKSFVVEQGTWVQILPTPKTDWCLDLIVRAIIMSGRHRFKCYRNYKKKIDVLKESYQKKKNILGIIIWWCFFYIFICCMLHGLKLSPFFYIMVLFSTVAFSYHVSYY